MKLTKLQIANYKCVHDSEEFELGDITCLVGKNESGKSALLEALTKLNPVDSQHSSFDPVMDYPRINFSEYKSRHADEPDKVIKLTAELDVKDIEYLRSVFGVQVDPLIDTKVIFTKDYANSTKVICSINHAEISGELLKSAKFSAVEKSQVKKFATISELINSLKEIAQPTQKHTNFLKHLQEIFPKGSATSAISDILMERLPRFLLFTDYYQLDGRVSLQQIREKMKGEHGGLTNSDNVFLALIALANSDLDELEKTDELEKIIAELEAISNRLSDDIFEYWTTNQNLEVQFRFDAAKPGDDYPFNSGQVFSIRVKNGLHRVTVPFDERSTGFRWFFSFLVWLTQVRDVYGDNLVILLDEPGVSLHGKAQADLLRYINEKLRPKHQVIYTTHSPFMVDPENLLAVRTVEDRVEGRNVLGTKVSGDALRADRDTILPLQGALGYDITQTFFVGPHTIVVEGPSDLLYLKWFSSELERRGKRGLDPRWSISPVGGLAKISSFVVLVGQQARNVAVVTDYAKGEKREVERLRRSEILKEGSVLSAEAYVEGAEADIEDLIGREAYVHIVAQCYDLKGEAQLPNKRPEGAPQRVVKEVEEHFKLLPAEIADFDHFRPAEFLTENGTALKDKIPKFDEAVERFEALITDLNNLIDG